MLHEWNELWTKSTNGNITRQLYFPTIYDRLKCKNIVQNFVLSQFLSGHGKFTEYLYRFKLSTSPTCSCGLETQNVHHLLFQCPLFSRERYHFELLLDSVGLTFSIPFTKILLNHNSYKFFNSFIHQIFCKLKTQVIILIVAISIIEFSGHLQFLSVHIVYICMQQYHSLLANYNPNMPQGKIGFEILDNK